MDGKSAVCMANKDKDNKHTSHITSRMYFVRNNEEWNIQKTVWCEGGIQLEYIGTKNGRED